jgi:hypothetical protein
MRADLEVINGCLAGLNVTFNDDGQFPRVDVRERSLRRYFNNGTMTDGGRLFGSGFWLNLAKARRHGLRIDGERVAGVDYGAMFLRLLYAEHSEQAPEGDLYALPGFTSMHRDGIKKCLSALLFKEGPLIRLPRDSVAMLPVGTKAAEVEAALRAMHPVVASAFGTRPGYRLMRKESDLLMDMLRVCREEDLPALPLHDAVLVPQSQTERARTIMLDCFAQNVGFDAVVTIKQPGDAGGDELAPDAEAAEV